MHLKIALFIGILILDTFTIFTIIIMTWIRDHGACSDASQRTPIDSPTLQYHTPLIIIMMWIVKIDDHDHDDCEHEYADYSLDCDEDNHDGNTSQRTPMDSPTHIILLWSSS